VRRVEVEARDVVIAVGTGMFVVENKSHCIEIAFYLDRLNGIEIELEFEPLA
jgi:hypothetical protein